jgi:hypothetical protein
VADARRFRVDVAMSIMKRLNDDEKSEPDSWNIEVRVIWEFSEDVVRGTLMCSSALEDELVLNG